MIVNSNNIIAGRWRKACLMIFVLSGIFLTCQVQAATETATIPAPSQAPVSAPTPVPAPTPAQNSTQAPVSAPSETPAQNSTQTPVSAPTQMPAQNSTQTPVSAPTQMPAQNSTQTPVSAPTPEPAPAAENAPSTTPTPTTMPETATTATAIAPAQHWHGKIQLNDLLTGEVPVPLNSSGGETVPAVGAKANQNNFSPAWQDAFRQALNQVLIKLTANQGVATLPAVRAQFQSVMPWVQSYNNITVLLDGKKHSYLQVKFDQSGILTALQQAKQKVWLTDRPPSLLYIVVGTGDQAKLLTASSDSPWLAWLKFAARLRGIKVVFPSVAEEAAQGSLSAAVLAKQDDLSLSDDQEESLRSQYHVANILLGRIDDLTADSSQQSESATFIQQPGSGWSSNWWLKTPNQSFSWTQSGDDQWSLSQKIIASLCNMLVNDASAVAASGPSSSVSVNVSGVNTIHQYQQVVRKLLKYGAVSGVRLQQAAATTIDLQVDVAGGADYLLKVLQQAGSGSLAVRKPAAATTDKDTAPTDDKDAAPTVADVLCSADLCLQWQGN